MAQRNVRKLILSVVLAAMGLAGAGGSLAKGASTAQSRALALKNLVDSVEGKATEPAMIRKTGKGYVRFAMAPRSTQFGIGQDKDGTAEEIAEAFLQSQRMLLCEDNTAIVFAPDRIKTQSGRTYIRYAQKFAGLEVFAGKMIIQTNSAGVQAVISDVMCESGTLKSQIEILDSVIDKMDAGEKAIEWTAEQYANVKLTASDPNLLIYDPTVVGLSGTPQIVWRVEVLSVGRIPVHVVVLLNAHDGTVVFGYPLIHSAFECTIRDGQYLIDDETVTLIKDDDQQKQYPCGDDEADLAYEYIQDCNSFYDSHHNRIGYNNSMAVAVIRYCPSADDCNWVDPNWFWDNAHWHPEGAGGADDRIRFGAGWVADDVVGHEFTHGVTEYTSGLNYSNESGAINESFSDMWGEWIDQENQAGTDTSAVKWEVFEDINNPVYGPGPIRDMEEPHDFNHPDYHEGTYWHALAQNPSRDNDWGGVHTNSGVGNKLCYLLTDGDTFSGYTISGMGRSDTAHLFYECQENLLLPASDYHDLGNYLQLAAVNLGFSASQRNNVEKACKAVGIYEGGAVFVVADSSGDPVAWFDDQGNLTLTGTLSDNDTPAATAGDEFIVKDSTGTVIATINMSTGDMVIQGDLDEDTTESPGTDDFIVKDSSGTTVAFIDEDTGDLCLEGKLYEPLD